MKTILIITFLLTASRGLAQSPTETEVLNLSNKIFTWEVQGKIDSLDKTFDEKFVVVNAAGESQAKKQYLDRLRSGNFVHNSVDVLENSAIVSGNTATVIGKGSFAVTVNGQNVVLKLAYLEVFARTDRHKPWKVLAMHASTLPENNK